jgi:succinate dehydrogenase / fumarate reductase, cytochrome b subunit
MNEADTPHDAENTRESQGEPSALERALGTPDPRAARDQRLRRLHTLSGAALLGTFLVEHLLTNASALGGASRYDAIVGTIERSRFLFFLEVFVLVPLAFHVGYGIQLLRRKSTPDEEIERYGDRRLWIVQRVSATFVFVFLLVHLWEFRVQRMFFGLAPDALHTVLAAHLSWTWGGVPWLALLYLIGIGATAFHFSNGLFAATAAWNIATTEPARRRMRFLTAVLGVGLFLVGAATVLGLATGTRLLPERDDVTPCGSAVRNARGSESSRP